MGLKSKKEKKKCRDARGSNGGIDTEIGAFISSTEEVLVAVISILVSQRVHLQWVLINSSFKQSRVNLSFCSLCTMIK